MLYLPTAILSEALQSSKNNLVYYTHFSADV